MQSVAPRAVNDSKHAKDGMPTSGSRIGRSMSGHAADSARDCGATTVRRQGRCQGHPGPASVRPALEEGSLACLERVSLDRREPAHQDRSVDSCRGLDLVAPRFLPTPSEGVSKRPLLPRSGNPGVRSVGRKLVTPTRLPGSCGHDEPHNQHEEAKRDDQVSRAR